MMKQRAWKKMVSLGLAVALLAGGLTACGGGDSATGTVTVDFMYGGDIELLEVYNSLIEEFNSTAGAEAKIRVKGIPKADGMEAVLAQQLPSNSGPDVVSICDEYFKKYTNYLDDMSGKIDQKVLDDFYPNALSRYHYNVATTTSNADDPLYGVPSYNDTTILYYNKTALEKAGVICISVAEEDLEAFNAGGKDSNGKTKADYGIESDVPAKGFYRSLSPFVPEADETNGASWVLPAEGEELIFNDKIAMNWDEVEDIGLICTEDRNPASSSKYGYFTEFWFNYGWSVGGDCIEDLSGNGDWTYALAGNLPNYIVGEGKTYKGEYSGIDYKAGDTLEIRDIVEANAGDTISYETDGSTYFDYTVNGTKADVRDFSQEIADGTLTELPSIRNAFSRFCYLAGEGGINVCPYPDVFTGSSSVYYFTSGKLAFLVEQISCASSIQKMMKEEWGIAPLPVYKTYTKPTDPACDTIAKQGKTAGHSLGYAISINVKSEVKDAAYTFVNWLSTEGQKFMAENGSASARYSDQAAMKENFPYSNADVVIQSLEGANPGDWWYMPDRTWINTWAMPLNNQVRYGKMDLDTFLYSYIEETNERLKEYKQ